jgi:hypothetical protein
LIDEPDYLEDSIGEDLLGDDSMTDDSMTDDPMIEDSMTAETFGAMGDELGPPAGMLGLDPSDLLNPTD